MENDKNDHARRLAKSSDRKIFTNRSQRFLVLVLRFRSLASI